MRSSLHYNYSYELVSTIVRNASMQWKKIDQKLPTVLLVNELRLMRCIQNRCLLPLRQMHPQNVWENTSISSSPRNQLDGGHNFSILRLKLTRFVSARLREWSVCKTTSWHGCEFKASRHPTSTTVSMRRYHSALQFQRPVRALAHGVKCLFWQERERFLL